MSKPKKTPAKQLRNKYVASVRARGASGYSLWFVAPPQDPLDLTLILSSDIEHDAFYYLEGSPDLPTMDYAPLRSKEARPRPGPRHFATATTLDGARLDIELGPEADRSSAPGRRLINLVLLDAAKIRIQSWRAIVPAINRCRSHNLNPLIFRCRRLLEENSELSAKDICEKLEPEDTALVIGALATMLRSREIQGDVDQHLWGPGTRFWGRTRG